MKKSWMWLLAMGVSGLALFPTDVNAAGTILDQSRYGIVTKAELAELLKMEARKKKASLETPAEFLNKNKEVRRFGDVYTTGSVQKNIKKAAKLLTVLSGKGGDAKFAEVLKVFEREMALVPATQAGPFKAKFPPNDEQIPAIQEIFKTLQDKPYCVVEGVPGSGKTSNVLIPIIHSIHEAMQGTKIYGTAPNDGGMKALQGDTKDFKTKITVQALGDILLNIEENSVLIIDEIYTATQDQLIDILKTATAKKLKIIFSGDSNQNLPTEKNILGLLPEPVATLRRTNRAQDGGYQEYTKLVLAQKEKVTPQVPLQRKSDTFELNRS